MSNNPNPPRKYEWDAWSDEEIDEMANSVLDPAIQEAILRQIEQNLPEIHEKYVEADNGQQPNA